MLYNSYQRRLIIDRCWMIYDFITKTFTVPHEFHIEIASIVEGAITSGYLQILVEISQE